MQLSCGGRFSAGNSAVVWQHAILSRVSIHRRAATPATRDLRELFFAGSACALPKLISADRQEKALG
jgi:hypothetical protein